MLSIEVEASAANDDNAPNWRQIDRKYEPLFSFQDDYATEVPAEQSSEIEMLTDGLKAAKKRVNSLKNFRTLYLDLEARWQECQSFAEHQFDELNGIVARIDNTEQSQPLRDALDNYHAVYPGCQN